MTELTSAMKDAKLIGETVSLNQLEYDRARLRAAKVLGCRPATLDKMRRRINRLVFYFYRNNDVVMPPAEPLERVGSVIEYTDDGETASGWCIADAALMRRHEARRAALLILPDGNGTTLEVSSRP